MSTTNRETPNQTTIVSHAVLTGVSALIPIPLLDDAVKTYFQRRLVRALAHSRGVVLSPEEVKTLADDAGGGCVSGCVGTVVFYPIKKIFRKIFFVLEWKRAVDLASLNFHRGFLLDHALGQPWLAPAGHRTVADLRAAVDQVVRETPTKPVEESIRATFRQSKSALVGAASLIQRTLSGLGGKPTAEKVGPAVESIEEEEERQVEGVVSSLAGRINALPKEHFESMRRRLDALLG